MKRNFIIPCLTVMVAITGFAFHTGLTVIYAAEQSGSVKLTRYTNGQQYIDLQPVPPELTYYIPLTGKTPLKTVLFKIQKNGSHSSDVLIPLNEDGTFSFVYLLKEGAGVYNVTMYGSPRMNSLSFSGIDSFTITAHENIPAALPGLNLNEKVLEFTNSVMGKKVGRGECWDLAQEALDRNGADWKRPVTYGQPLNPDTDVILPGDIIQFRTVKIVEHLDNGVTRTYHIGMPDHTAVIYKVLGIRNYQLAHQNTGGKRVVLLSEVNLTHITSGQFWIYRPHAVLLRELPENN